jgi:hypothetical protein
MKDSSVSKSPATGIGRPKDRDLIKELSKELFPDGIDLRLLFDDYGKSPLPLQMRTKRFVEAAKRLRPQLRNRKVPSGLDLPGKIRVGVSLVEELSADLSNDFAQRRRREAPTETGDGKVLGKASYGDMGPLISLLYETVGALELLTDLAKQKAPLDDGDVEFVYGASDIQNQDYYHGVMVKLLGDLWLHWVTGYRIPGLCISSAWQEQSKFGGWRYKPLQDFMADALFYFDGERGMGKHQRFPTSTAKKMLHTYWAEIRGRIQGKGEDKKIADRARSVLPVLKHQDGLSALFLDLPHRGRRKAPLSALRTSEDEEILRRHFTFHQRVERWICSTKECAYLVDGASHPMESAGRYDRYVCPNWFDCAGLLKPEFDSQSE